MEIKLFRWEPARKLHRQFTSALFLIKKNEERYLTVSSNLSGIKYINFDNIHKFFKKLCIILVVCCFTFVSIKMWAPIAIAGSIYKSVMPDGRVMYGEKPQPGASSVKKSKVDISDTGVKPASKTEIESINRRAQKRSQLLDKTLETVQAAEDDLRKAEIDREAGIEPLPGERLGIVGRGTRLSEAYWRRQQILEERVETARQLLKKARQGYNEVR